MDTNIQKYIAFVKTVECKSLSKAAGLLGYSQSSISHMLNDLEEEWGVMLLTRSRAGIQLTSDGIKILPYAQKLCEDFQQIQEQVENLNKLETGLIRIGTFSSVATHLLPEIIKRFHNHYPNVSYELLLGDYNQVEHWISEGRVDCGFLRLPTLPRFETVSLGLDQMLVVLPENHRYADCGKFPVKALEEDSFMMVEKGGDAEIADIFRQNKIHPRIQFTTWDDHAIMAMVEKGLGISILPELVLRRTPYHIVKKELEIPAYREIGLALKNRKTAPLAVKCFLDHLLSCENNPAVLY